MLRNTEPFSCTLAMGNVSPICSLGSGAACPSAGPALSSSSSWEEAALQGPPTGSLCLGSIYKCLLQKTET